MPSPVKQDPKHTTREQLRSQCINQPVSRRPRQFAGMDYASNRHLLRDCLDQIPWEQEKLLIRTLLTGALWTALRAHQRGMRDSPLCPYYKRAPQTEEHALWHCPEWTLARDALLLDVRAQAAQLPDLPTKSTRHPYLKLCGLPPPPLPICPQLVKDNAIAFILAISRGTKYAAAVVAIGCCVRWCVVAWLGLCHE